MVYLVSSIMLIVSLLWASVNASPAADPHIITTPPTFLYRHVPDLPEKPSEFTTPSCHFKPVFVPEGLNKRIMRSLAHFAEITVLPSGSCAEVQFPRREQIYVVLEGQGAICYLDRDYPVRALDFLYVAPGVHHQFKNDSSKKLRLFSFSYWVRKQALAEPPAELPIANIEDVPLQVLGNHPPSVKYRLLMGPATSKRDRLAVAHTLTSLFVMEFEPGGTNQPHHHVREEELYYVMSGEGTMVAGGGVDGIENRRPARAGDAYFFRLNCTVGFYASPDPSAPRARILAARSLFPFDNE